MAREDPIQLCRRCGLCCDGSLFSHVSLSDEEARGLGENLASVRIRETGSGKQLVQACGALVADACSVYACRPAACASYECNLLKAAAAGEVELEEAAQVVDDLKREITDLAMAVLGGDSVPASLQEIRSLAIAGDPRVSPDAAARLKKIERALEKHFLGRSKGARSQGIDTPG